MTNLPDLRFFPPLISRHRRVSRPQTPRIAPAMRLLRLSSVPSIAHCDLVHAIETMHEAIIFCYS
jgi:hypothetical protein